MRERLRSTMLAAVPALSSVTPLMGRRRQRPPAARSNVQCDVLETRMGFPFARSTTLAIHRSLPGASGVPLNVSDHRSLNWHGVLALPPETSMRFRAASKAATCRPRAAGPGTSETDDHASVPVSESVQTSLSGAALE